MKINPAAILTNPVVKDLAKSFAINAAATAGALAGMGAALAVGGKVMERREKKLAKKNPTIEPE